MWQQLLAVFLVLALLLATLALFRRKGLAQFRPVLRNHSGRPREMQVLERIALSPQHSLHLVNVRDSVFLIGVGPSGCHKIDVLRAGQAQAELRESA
jgi:flagellar biogenesis protein FliO